MKNTYFSSSDILEMESRQRAAFINSLSGFKSASLIGSIDSNGNIGYQNYSSGFSNFINSSQVNFDLHHRFNAASRIKGGLMYEQRPYGLNGAGAAIFYEHRL